ncbi:DUF6297 family protein [Actinoplanes xinjiangensis]|uniref:ABC-2 type transport system permease protein n=1 Tax=Actinoplanes xinjiangensis TaxID=512350 RepID=A0A316FNS0_9ACTN|nr:DUF6297 family protein [Actinoplanes xinjiangensis]PWK50481.1 hypothetical protein BC793_103366 [Actinoplanes xinjiangensis]GIF36367.1 hypothetical protein Axi01nite_06780 [Actinoplanes xinjiangensis]
MTAVVALRPVRRWIRKAQASHRDRGDALATVYTAVFSIAVLSVMAQDTLRAVFSPLVPHLSGVGAVAAAACSAGLIHLALRRLGPVTVTRPAAYFLLTAPVSRQRLLAPSLVTAALGAALAGGAAAFGILGNAAATGSIVLVATGALAGVLLALLASAAQSRPRLASLVDTAARIALAVGLAGLVAEAIGWTPPTLGGEAPALVLVTVTGALAVVAFILGVRDLARTPNDAILESAKTTGTLADSVYGIEPSFFAEMLERRYWASRRLRSARLPHRLPPLTGQDLLLARRRPARLLWTAASTALPLLLISAPRWVLVIALLTGTVIAARGTTATIKTDAGNPVLLRMLGLTSRQVVQQRLWLPAVLGAAWATMALGLLQVAGALPPGQWWALGPAIGAIGGAAAIRAARAGFVRNDLIPIDTPMGSVPTGPVVYAFAGLDLLLLTLPTVIRLFQDLPATWSVIAVQTGLAALGVRAYISWTTDPERVGLSK